MKNALSDASHAVVVFGVCYPSVAAAAKANGLSPTALVSHMCKYRAPVERAVAALLDKAPRISVFGKTFSTVDEAMEAIATKRRKP